MKVKSFAVMGLGRFGSSAARALSAMGHEVLAVDRREDAVAAIKDSVLHAVVADTTDERALIQLGVSNFDCVLVCYGEDLRASILTTVLCKEHGAKRVIAKAKDNLHATLLTKTGADRVVQPEHDGGVRLARSLSSESVIDSLDLSDEYSVNEVRTPASWVGKNLIELNVRKKFGLSVIAIRRDAHLTVNIDPEEPLHADDTLFVLGDNRSLARIS